MKFWREVSVSDLCNAGGTVMKKVGRDWKGDQLALQDDRAHPISLLQGQSRDHSPNARRI